MKVLVIDDEEDILELAKNFLEKKQKELSVGTASSGNRALEMIEDNSYDAIVADYKMPEMDGLELLKRIREKGMDIPFYILTGRGEEGTSDKALNLGATGYFVKSAYVDKGFDKLDEILVKSIEKRQKTDKHLIAWITLRKGWGEVKDEKFKQALKDLGEIVGFKISEIETREVSPEKKIIKAYTDNYPSIPRTKMEIGGKWKEIVTNEPEVIEAGFRSQKIKQYNNPY